MFTSHETGLYEEQSSSAISLALIKSTATEQQLCFLWFSTNILNSFLSPAAQIAFCQQAALWQYLLLSQWLS
jgi:hypothetical protein